MSTGIPRISILQGVAITPIIQYLYKNQNKEIITTDLIKEINSANDTIIKALDFLEANGLILKEKTKKFPFKHIVKLSEYGLEVARLLELLENTLVEAARKN